MQRETVFCSYLLLGVKGNGINTDQCVLEDCFLFSFLIICVVNVFQNPAATAFGILWMIFEPILFGLTGTQIKFNELDRDTVGIGTACLITGIAVSIWHSTLLLCEQTNRVKQVTAMCREKEHLEVLNTVFVFSVSNSNSSSSKLKYKYSFIQLPCFYI
jgi:hypothetical protein